MRIIVQILMDALATSNNVPPMDPLMMLLASHNSVLANNTQRNRTPRIVKIATVAMQEPITGNQPAADREKAKPNPIFAATITPPRIHER